MGVLVTRWSQRRPPTNVETGSEKTSRLPGSDRSTRQRRLRHWSGTTGVLNGVRLLGPSGAVQAGVAWTLRTHYEMVLHVRIHVRIHLVPYSGGPSLFFPPSTLSTFLIFLLGTQFNLM